MRTIAAICLGTVSEIKSRAERLEYICIGLDEATVFLILCINSVVLLKKIMGTRATIVVKSMDGDTPAVRSLFVS